MSFHIKLYKYSGEQNRLNKLSLLSNEIDLVGVARESVDKMNCDIRIERSGTLDGYNYAYVQEFNRYYFIDTITIERNNIIRISLTTDVLMSHRSAINNCTGLVARNENLYNTQIIDDQLRFLGYKAVNTLKLPYSLKGSESFILAVNGGV